MKKLGKYLIIALCVIGLSSALEARRSAPVKHAPITTSKFYGYIGYQEAPVSTQPTIMVSKARVFASLLTFNLYTEKYVWCYTYNKNFVDVLSSAKKGDLISGIKGSRGECLRLELRRR